jgi:RepB DNA-primase from phage plasmid
MSVQIDEATVRQFIELINEHVTEAINGAGAPGLLQLSRIHPLDDKSVVPSRFALGDVEGMVKLAIGDASAGHNVYLEARTVRDGLRGNRRGNIEDTAWVFGLVIDSDSDKGKGGNVTVRPSLAVETSPGNFQLWYLLTRVIPAEQARAIGDAIRTSSGTDQDTGVITQCYRVPGTPNFPSLKKQARGRITVEPTRIFECTRRLWDPDELLAAFATPAPAPQPPPQPQPTGLEADEATLPDDLLEIIRLGGSPTDDRSVLFHRVVKELWLRRWTIETITELLDKYPQGIAEKYGKRLRKEVERSYAKFTKGAGTSGPSSGAGPAVTGTTTATPGPATAGTTTASAGPAGGTGTTSTTPPRVLPTIYLEDGQLPRVVTEVEKALIAANTPMYSRGGMLVEPVKEARLAADGRKTVTARLRQLCPDSLLEPIAEAAILQRYNGKRKRWVHIDPPLQLARLVLTRERRWAFPHVAGVITTPTLRADGSLLSTEGYDPRSELYLTPGVQLPPIPERPTREQALKALERLTGLFREFSFSDRERKKRLNQSVTLSGLLTASIRGSLPTAPVHLIRADTPGTGKSYLVDVIAVITIGTYCPVITASRSMEETEKRIGAVLLEGIPLVSLDNCTHDLGGELLCQLSERPVIRIRVLGQSAMPRCECHTMVFATGNNIGFLGDMIRRGLVCDLEALDERPELRKFETDALKTASVNRGDYLAAMFTIIRAYLAVGAPEVCGPLGSYPDWSRMVRSPLVWLGEPDPVLSMDTVRAEDPVLADMREFFDLWIDYDLGFDTPHITNRIIELACAPPGGFNQPVFEEFLCRVATGKDGKVSSKRFGEWLRRISGRVVTREADGCRYRLILGRLNTARATFALSKIAV